MQMIMNRKTVKMALSNMYFSACRQPLRSIIDARTSAGKAEHARRGCARPCSDIGEY